MRRTVFAVAALALLAWPTASAQVDPDTLDLNETFNAWDSIGGRPLLDSLPQLIDCPKFDPTQIRGDASTFSFERRPELERLPQRQLFVELEFVVRRDGKVDRRRIRVRSSSDSRLDQSVQYWVRGCVFRPGYIGEHKVKVKMRRRWELQLTNN